MNFLRDTDTVMKIPPSMKAAFKKKLYYDKEFLKQNNLMDYSLLLIVFSKKEFKEEADLEGAGEGFLRISKRSPTNSPRRQASLRVRQSGSKLPSFPDIKPLMTPE